MTQITKNITDIIVAGSFLLFLFLPQASQAAPKLLNTVGSVEHYTYSSSCSGTGTQNLIVNTTQSSYSNIYFFFHGQTSPSPKGFCEGAFQLCSRAKEQPSSLFVGVSMKGSGNQWVSKVDFPCLYNEAKTQLDELGIPMPSSVNMAAFSYGGRALQNIFNQGKQQGNVKSTLFFDACFGSWCSDVAKKSSSIRGSQYMYASSATDNDNGKKNQEAAAAAIKASSDATRYVHVPVNNHGLIPNICFWDHINSDLCQGKGVLKSSSDLPQTPAEPVQNPAGKGNFGKECDTDADCPVGNECEQSIHPNGKEYCVCEEDAHCVEEYGGDPKEWTCSNGSNASYELNYCLKGSTPYYPIGENPAAKNATSDVGRAFDGAALSESEIQKLLKKPVPKIRIPGLEFSEISVEGLSSMDAGGKTYLNIPFLGQYIASLYKYLIILITVVSTVFLIIGGMQWILGGSGSGKEEIKQRMINSLIGLIVALSSYVILHTINPDLVQFKALKVLYAQPNEFFATPPENDEDNPNLPADTTIAAKPNAQDEVTSDLFMETGINGPKANGWQIWQSFSENQKKEVLPHLFKLIAACPGEGNLTNITGIPGWNGMKINSQALEPFRKANKLASELGFVLYPGGVYRPSATQLRLWNTGVAARYQRGLSGWENNQGKIARPSCKSPHLSGGAVDVNMKYIASGKKLAASDPFKITKSNYATKFLGDPYKIILEYIFNQAGWLRLCSEHWHFEYGVTVSYGRWDKTSRCWIGNETYDQPIPDSMKAEVNKIVGKNIL